MMTRPPPLQLHLDSSPSPVQPHSQFEILVTKIYQTNWRNFVIGVAAVNALRFFISASNAFQDVGVDNLHHVPKLAQVSTALGAMYITVGAIELFGVFSVSLRNRQLVRVYAHLAFISALLVTAAGFIAGLSYFTLADDVVRECISLTLSGKVYAKSIFRWDPWPKTILPAKAAQAHCLKAWTSESTSQSISVFLFSLIPSILFFLLAYTYYRQTTNPRHPASLCTSGHRSAIRMEAYPEAPYSPLYNQTALQYSDDITEALGVRFHGRGATKQKPKPSVEPLPLSPMMRTASPYMLTPGPPSYGRSRNAGPWFTVGSDDGRAS